MRDKDEAVHQFMDEGGFTETEATIAYLLDEAVDLFIELEDEEIEAGVQIVRGSWQTPHDLLTGLLQRRVFKRHHPYAYVSNEELEKNRSKEAPNEEGRSTSEKIDPRYLR